LTCFGYATDQELALHEKTAGVASPHDGSYGLLSTR
jgi:hypothetical protein